MGRNFERAVEVGRMGERLVARWFQSHNWGVIPSYDYTGSNGEKAPRLMFEAASHVVPDLDLCRSGRRWWVEVKTYADAAENKRLGCKVHGIKQRHFDDYVSVERESGTPVAIAILELSTGLLLTGALDRLSGVSFGCQCRGCARGAQCRAPIGRLRYWRRSAMSAAHQFCAEDLAEVRAARSELKAGAA